MVVPAGFQALVLGLAALIQDLFVVLLADHVHTGRDKVK
jgi:hypothetical protein